MTWDLDAATEESKGEAWSFTFRGETFEMPGDLAWEVTLAYARFAEEWKGGGGSDEENMDQLAAVVHIEDALRRLFASPEDYERFAALRPTQAHVLKLIERATTAEVGATLGEARRSDDSSENGAGRSVPTSPTTTGGPSTV